MLKVLDEETLSVSRECQEAYVDAVALLQCATRNTIHVRCKIPYRFKHKTIPYNKLFGIYY